MALSVSSSASTYVGVDLSALATPVRTAAPAKAPASFTTAKVALPDRANASLTQALAQVRARASLVEPDAPSVKRAGTDPDLRAAFTAYRALDGLRTLAQAAASKTLNATTRASVAAQFTQGLADLQSHVATAPTSKLLLQFGAKVSRLESAAQVRPDANYTGAAVVRGSRASVLNGIAGTEQLTLTLAKTGHADTLTVDLADISGPVTLDSVAALINDRIATLTDTDAQGLPVLRYGTRFAVARTNPLKEVPAAFALQALNRSTEQVSLADAAAPPVGYGLATRDGKITLRRIDGLDGPLASRTIATVALDTASATAVDSTGAIYVVGTTRRDIGGQSSSSKADATLAKYDSNGVLLFARKLGGAGTADGLALAIDAQDNVYVGGSFDGHLGKDILGKDILGKDILGGRDSLVIKFNAQGQELFARTLDSAADDRISQIVVSADNRVFVSGSVDGALPGQSAAGRTDQFLAELAPATGALLTRRQSGTSAADAPALMALARDGSLLAASVENSRAVMRVYANADMSVAPREIDLGDIGTGTLSSLAVNGQTGAIAVGGTAVRSGVPSGIVVQLTSDFAAAPTTDITSARVDSLVWSSATLVAAGRTLAAGSRVTDDAIIRIDAATGAILATHTSGASGTRSGLTSLTTVDQGPGVLAQLGLRQGPLRLAKTPALVDKTTLRTGDSFTLIINDITAKISVTAQDDLQALARKIRGVTRGSADVSVQEGSTGTRLVITAKGNARLVAQRGPDGQDMLAKLGIEPGAIRSAAALFDLGKSPVEVARTPGGSFALDLSTSLSIADAGAAAEAIKKLDTSLGTIQRAYRSLYYDPAREALARERAQSGPVPAYLTQQLSQYQDALARLQSSSPTSGVSL